MNRLVFLLLFMLLISFLRGQKTNIDRFYPAHRPPVRPVSGYILHIDSLQQALQVSREDTNRVLILQEMAFNYAIRRLDSAILYSNKGIELSKKLKYPKGEALCLMRQAIYYRVTGASEQGMQYALKAVPTFEKLKDIDNIITCNLLIAWTLEDQEYPKLSNEYVLKVTPMARQYNSEMLHYCYTTLCTNYNKLNVLDSALLFGLKADTIVPNDIFNVSSIGDIYLKMGNISEAEKYYTRVKTAFNKDGKLESYVYRNLSKLYNKKNQIDSAIYFAKKALPQKKNDRSYFKTLNASATFLVELYKKKGIKDSMMVYMQIVIDTKDSLTGQEKINLVSLLYTNQLYQQELEARQLGFEKQVQIVSLLTALIVFLLIAFIFYRNNKQKQKEELFHQKIRIASDMHDDIGSDLSALNMQIERICQKVKAGKQPLSELNHLVESSRDIAQKVREVIWTINARHDTLSSIIHYFDTYVEDLFEPTDMLVRTSIPAEIPDVIINGENRKVLLMCFKETLNNAYKHAHATEIHIAFTTDNHLLTITIADNGVGFDPSVLTASTTNGNGLVNLQERMKGIGGKCVIETSEKGTQVVLSLPIGLNSKIN